MLKGKTFEEIEQDFDAKISKKRLQTTKPSAIVDEKQLTSKISGKEASL